MPTKQELREHRIQEAEIKLRKCRMDLEYARMAVVEATDELIKAINDYSKAKEEQCTNSQKDQNKN